MSKKIRTHWYYKKEEDAKENNYLRYLAEDCKKFLESYEKYNNDEKFSKISLKDNVEKYVNNIDFWTRKYEELNKKIKVHFVLGGSEIIKKRSIIRMESVFDFGMKCTDLTLRIEGNIYGMKVKESIEEIENM